ncbi:MAG: LysR family transcriptional regulator [Verrucomicrobiota bacterium]
MFSKLFAESGLSLDRLKAFLAVAAAGSIVKAAAGDPVKQSQFSRQIKELEDFFRIQLVERHGKGIRLTASGKELARISRFFLLGLSNFQRGCLTEEQTFRVGASPTVIDQFLVPLLSQPGVVQGDTRYLLERAGEDEIERRLHDLTLDFGVTTRSEISRPLPLKEVRKWRLKLWVPEKLHKSEKAAQLAFAEGRLPLAVAERDLAPCDTGFLDQHDRRLTCDTFLEAMAATKEGALASVLPDFLDPRGKGSPMRHVRIPALESRVFHYRLAWNPRLLRLNPHATRRRDFLLAGLSGKAP